MRTLFFALLILSSASCDSSPGAPHTTSRAAARAPAARSAQPDTAPYARVLSAYLHGNGRFDYAGLHADTARVADLNTYVTSIGAANPDAWPRDEQLAFYLNAYNALVLQSVERRWPIDSVMHEDGFFDSDVYTVAGAQRTLNALETNIIRGSEFAEPRIHFAVNCASVGCPRLWPTPFTARNLEAELERRARLFVRATTQVDRTESTATVSKIFSWFARDFGPAGGLNEFIAERLDEADAAVLRAPALIPDFADYDWALNAPAAHGAKAL